MTAPWRSWRVTFASRFALSSYKKPCANVWTFAHGLHMVVGCCGCIQWLSIRSIHIVLMQLVSQGAQGNCAAKLESWWREFRAENGFEGVVLHELRHTQATLLLANGTDIKTVQARMGHSSAAFTMDRYAHAVQEKDDQAADLMGRIISGRIKQEARVIPLKSA